MVIGAGFNGPVGEGTTGDEEGMGSIVLVTQEEGFFDNRRTSVSRRRMRGCR